MWEKVVAYFPDAYFMPLLAKLRANRVQSTVSLRLSIWSARCGSGHSFAAISSDILVSFLGKAYEYQPLAYSRPQCSVGLCLPPAQFLRK